MLDECVRALWLAWTALSLAGCPEPAWARQTWPSTAPGQLAQPEAHAEPLGLHLSARAITWEPAAIVIEVELVLVQASECELDVEPDHVFLEYDGLEYAPTRADPSDLNQQTIELRYELGRALTGAGARLRLRGLTCAGERVVDVPELPVPAMPADARELR